MSPIGSDEREISPDHHGDEELELFLDAAAGATPGLARGLNESVFTAQGSSNPAPTPLPPKMALKHVGPEFGTRGRHEIESLRAIDDEVALLVETKSRLEEANRVACAELVKHKASLKRESESMLTTLREESVVASRTREKFREELEMEREAVEAERCRMDNLRGERMVMESQLSRVQSELEVLEGVSARATKGLDDVRSEAMAAKTAMVMHERDLAATRDSIHQALADRDREIAANEDVRNDILESNDIMLRKQDALIRNLADLEARRLAASDATCAGSAGSTGRVDDGVYVPVVKGVRWDKTPGVSESVATGTPETAKPAYNRRRSMPTGMQEVYDKNPCISGLGLDCYSRTEDGTEVMAWSLREAARLTGSRNAARRVARIPKPFTGRGLWKDDWQGFLDDMSCNGWTMDEALPHLVSWLKDGPGKTAVDKWRDEHGANGSFTELVQTASYVFGTLVNEDPMATFRKRSQKPHESHKIFGIELQHLLHKARPTWRNDDECFLQELFTHFLNGLKDGEQRQVAYDAWKGDASLADLFLAIDNFNTKKALMAGRIPQKISTMCAANAGLGVNVDEAEASEADFAAVNFKGKYNRPDKAGTPRVEGAQGPESNSGASNMPSKGKSGAKACELPANFYDEIASRLKSTLSVGVRRASPVDKTGRRCYRCQTLGHFAAECTAANVVPSEGVRGGVKANAEN